MNNDNCLRCGLPEEHQRHDRRNPPPEGWHLFHGQDYLDGVEDALLFAREKKQHHKWEETGVTIDAFDGFDEKFCKVCGAINWGGAEDGICFGNRYAETAIVQAHNRRAFKLTNERHAQNTNLEKGM
jgi:hypothetical protein